LTRGAKPGAERRPGRPGKVLRGVRNRVVAAAAGGPPDPAAVGAVMRRHGLNPRTARDADNGVANPSGDDSRRLSRHARVLP